MEEENKNPICCFCGNHCEDEFGNNPYPANNEEDARCCNDCNETVVIPARINALVENKYKKEGE